MSTLASLRCRTFLARCGAWAFVAFAAMPSVAAPPVIASFTAQRGAVGNAGYGTSDTLHWSVSGATQLTIDQGVGDVTAAPYSQASVSPTAPTTYTLTAANADGVATASVRVAYVPLVQLSADTWMTESAIYHVPGPGVVTWPGYASIYAWPTIDNVYVPLLQGLFPADYFMVAIVANDLVPGNVPIVTTRRHVADGIGNTNITGVGVPNLCRYTNAGAVTPGVLGVFDHEMGHNWGARVGVPLGWGHWLSNSTVGGQMAQLYSEDGYTTLKLIAGTPAAGFTWTAVNNWTHAATETYAEQDLYSIGVQPLFPDTWVLADPVYNPDGTMSYSSATKYDHAWVVANNGPRVPSYTTSEKQVRLGFIFVARDLAEIQDAFLNLELSIRHYTGHEVADGSNSAQVPFLATTKQRMSAVARLADLDGNATPTLSIAGETYRISTDGAAAFAFSAADPDGPAPAVSFVPPTAQGTIGAGQASVSGLPPGTHFFTIKAEDAGGKKAFAHFVVDVVTPGVFVFAPQSGVAPGSTVTSNTVVVTGIAANSPISAWGGTYAINGGAWKSVSGLVNPGDTVTLRQVAPASLGLSATATLMVGTASGAFTVSTDATVPGAPGLVAVAGGSASVTVSFTAPAGDGGSPLLDYTATCLPGPFTATLAAPATSIPVTGLANGVSYACTVRARNAIGSGPESGALSATPGLPPAFTSAAAATFTLNAAGSFTVAATGTPAPVFAVTSGTLPAGVSLQANTGVLSGTPGPGSAGTHVIGITAANGSPPDALQSFTLTVARGPQAIAFPALAGRALSVAPFTPPASSASGLAVAFSSLTPATCAVNANLVTLLAVGSCTLQADQAGDADWLPAPPVTQAFAVTKGVQVVSFAAPADHAFGSGTFTVSATATSGLAVSFGSFTGTICGVAGTTVYLYGVGTCTLAATQGGNANWLAATQSRSFQVTQGAQSITFAPIADRTVLMPGFMIAATSSAGLTVSLTSLTPQACTVTNGVYAPVAIGTCTVQATQAGTANYAPAAPVQRSFAVTAVPQSIQFAAIADRARGSGSFVVNPTSSITSVWLQVSVASVTPATCSCAAGAVTLVAPGTCTLEATQPGDATYAPAPPVTRSFAILCDALGAGDCDGDGLPDMMEAAEGRNPHAKDNDVFSSSRLFAMQQYRDFLSREGDAGGISYWIALLGSGTTRAGAIQGFFSSPEFQGVIAPVARLYFAYFLRYPDYVGLQYHASRSRTGTALAAISAEFAGSPEFQARYGALTDGGFVDLVYQNVLGRPAEPAGKAYWLARMAAGETRGQVMAGFSESPEFVAASTSRVFVTMMYAGMLRRAPDPAGFPYWVAHMDGGQSGLDLTGGFLDSAEYRARFLP